MNRCLRGLVVVHFLVVCFVYGSAQTSGAQATLVNDLRGLVQTPAVPGYEQQLAAEIAGKLKSFAPKIDAQSNVTVTIGKGAPHRLLVTSMDEPGFVASGITNEGYLTLQRLPQGGNLPLLTNFIRHSPYWSARRRINGSMERLRGFQSIYSRNVNILLPLPIWTTCL